MPELKSFPKPHRERLKGDTYREFAQEILRRDGYRCRYCGSMKGLTIHHLTKRSQLGGDTPGNTLTLCVPCHDLVEANQLKIEVIDVVVKFHERKEAKDEEAEKPKDESGGVPT